MNNKILMILVSIIYNKIIHYNYVNKVNKSHLSKYNKKIKQNNPNNKKKMIMMMMMVIIMKLKKKMGLFN